MGVIPDLNSGFMGQKAFAMVVTNYRLIFAQITNKMMKEEIERAKAQAQQQGAGTFGKWTASVGAGFNIHQRYYQMPPQAILQESPGNFEIRPELVKSVRISHGHYDPQYSHQTPNKMVIKWSGGKNKFTFERIDPQQIRNLLTPLLGTKVK